MAAIARHGDFCGGTLIASATTVRVNTLFVVRLGDQVTPHGDDEHAAAVMVEASSTVRAQVIPVCGVGDHASCGHAIMVGSPNVSAG